MINEDAFTAVMEFVCIVKGQHKHMLMLQCMKYSSYTSFILFHIISLLTIASYVYNKHYIYIVIWFIFCFWFTYNNTILSVYSQSFILRYKHTYNIHATYTIISYLYITNHGITNTITHIAIGYNMIRIHNTKQYNTRNHIITVKTKGKHLHFCNHKVAQGH